MSSTNFFTSTNLITDLKFKQQVGVKADSFEEALAILNQEEENKLKNPDDLKIELEKRDELQINAKLFMKSFSSENALKAVQTLKQVLGVEKIDSLTISIPSEGIDHLGIGDHSSSTEDLNKSEITEPETDIVENKIRQNAIEKLLKFWNELSESLSEEIITMGVCDLETDVLFQLYNQSKFKPKYIQVNLKSCCVVPPDLQAFAKENSVKLSTHADPPTILSSEFVNKIDSKELKSTEWIVRYQLFIKSRGVLQDKRYIFPF